MKKRTSTALTPWVEQPVSPSLKVSEDKNSYSLKMSLPGMEKKDLKVSLSGNTLTISGEKKQEREEKKKDMYYHETRYGAFSRSFPLSAQVKKDRMASRFENGLLTVVLPKKKD